MRINPTILVGLGALLVLLAITLLNPGLGRSAHLTLVVLQAVSAAIATQGLTGQLDISGTWLKWSIKAGGPFALAVLVLSLGLKFMPSHDDGPVPSVVIGKTTYKDVGEVSHKEGNTRVKVPPKTNLDVNTTTTTNVKRATVERGDTVVDLPSK
jgi:hypothetical protein